MDINSCIVQAVTKAWNMAFRWIFGLHKFDSTSLLTQSCGTMSAKFLLHKRLLLFNNGTYLSNVICIIYGFGIGLKILLDVLYLTMILLISETENLSVVL